MQGDTEGYIAACTASDGSVQKGQLAKRLCLVFGFIGTVSNHSLIPSLPGFSTPPSLSHIVFSVAIRSTFYLTRTHLPPSFTLCSQCQLLSLSGIRVFPSSHQLPTVVSMEERTVHLPIYEQLAYTRVHETMYVRTPLEVKQYVWECQVTMTAQRCAGRMSVGRCKCTARYWWWIFKLSQCLSLDCQMTLDLCHAFAVGRCPLGQRVMTLIWTTSLHNPRCWERPVLVFTLLCLPTQ